MAGVRKATLSAVTLLIALLGASQVKADPITFSTSGTFTCAGCSGSGTNSVTFLGGMGNAILITFTGLGSTSLDTPTGSSLGNFQIFVSGAGATASGTFTLTITQTVPTAGSDSFSANFSGTWSASNSGEGLITFTDGTMTIGGVVYTIAACPGPLKLVPPASNNGITTVNALVTFDPA